MREHSAGMSHCTFLGRVFTHSGHKAALGSGSVHPGNRHLPASRILSRNGLNSRILRDASQLSLALIRSLANVWLVRQEFANLETDYERSRFRPFVREPTGVAAITANANAQCNWRDTVSGYIVLESLSTPPDQGRLCATGADVCPWAIRS